MRIKFPPGKYSPRKLRAGKCSRPTNTLIYSRYDVIGGIGLYVSLRFSPAVYPQPSKPSWSGWIHYMISRMVVS
jgi:hypothetical protein